MNVLLVEDELRIADALSELIRLEQPEQNFVNSCSNGLEAVDLIAQNKYDIIILDIILPGLSGIEILRHIRKLNITTPVLMLTAKGELDDKIKGLENGADDYMTKPFESRELIARLHALLRRFQPVENKILTFGDVNLVKDNMTLACTSKNQTVKLGKKEYQLLEYFLLNQNQVITREQLALKIWGYESEAEYNNVEVYISFVRKKLDFIGSCVEIKAIRGIGYELRDTHV